MNLIAFARHTLADLVDAACKAARAVVGTRKRFFEELRVMTTDLVFPGWSRLIETLTAGKPPPAVLGGRRTPLSRTPTSLQTHFLPTPPPQWSH